MERLSKEILISCYGEEDQACIHWLKIDAETGKVDRLNQQAGIKNPSFLAKHPTVNRLYAVSEVEDGEVVCYQIDDANRSLKERGRLPTHGGPCYVEVSETGDYLFVSNYSNAGVIVYALDQNGDLQEEVERIDFTSEGNVTSHIHTIRQVPGTSFLVMTDIGKSKLYIYQWVEEQRRLLQVQVIDLPDNVGPRHVAFHPDQPILYLVNEYQSSVFVYRSIDLHSSVQLIQRIETTDAIKNYGAEIQYIDGKVMTSNRGDDSVTIFQVQQDGLLQKEASFSTGGLWPRHFCSNQPLNNQLIVCNQNSNTVTIFKQEKDTFMMAADPFDVSAPVCALPVN